MECITSGLFSLLYNGKETKAIRPTQGIWQGDPISLYIFLPYLGKLAHRIYREVEGRRWRPIKASRGRQEISHLFFAHELLFFAEASMDRVETVKARLSNFSRAFGQKINFAKSKSFFSANIDKNMVVTLSMATSIPRTDDLGRYLGVPLLHKWVTKNLYVENLEKWRKRLLGRKSKSLSLAKNTFAKSVLNSLSVYQMQTAMLPVAATHDIDRCTRQFIWGGNEEKRNIHLLD